MMFLNNPKQSVLMTLKKVVVHIILLVDIILKPLARVQTVSGLSAPNVRVMGPKSVLAVTPDSSSVATIPHAMVGRCDR